MYANAHTHRHTTHRPVVLVALVHKPQPCDKIAPRVLLVAKDLRKDLGELQPHVLRGVGIVGVNARAAAHDAQQRRPL